MSVRLSVWHLALITRGTLLYEPKTSIVALSRTTPFWNANERTTILVFREPWIFSFYFTNLYMNIKIKRPARPS